MKHLIEPKEITLTSEAGKIVTFVISKIPYMPDGREIGSQFIPTAMPKVGDYPRNEALSRKIWSYVAVKTEQGQLVLETDALINNHVPDAKTAYTVEKEMMEYNFGFFDSAKISAFVESAGQKVVKFLMPILTQLQAQSSKKDAPPSSN